MKKFSLYYITPYLRINALCSAHMGIKPVGYYYDGESHDFWEAVFILKGTAGITAGESIYSLSEGNMIFHPPGEFHRLWNEGNESLRIAVVSFGADPFPITKHTVCSFDSSTDVINAINNLKENFEMNGIIVNEVKSHRSANAQISVVALENLFIRLLEQYASDEENKKNG